MAFVPVPNVAYIKIVGLDDGQDAINDLYFVSTAPPISQFTLAALVLGIRDWWQGMVMPLISETYVGIEIQGRDLTEQTSFVSSLTLGTGTGGVSGEQAPNNVSSNLVFRSGIAGRGNHGSNRIPAIPNSVVDTNVFAGTFLDDVAAAYSDLLAGGGSTPAGWTWVVVHRFEGSSLVDGKKVPTPLAEGTYREVFSCVFPDNFVDSQKSRLPRHGK